MTRASRNFFYRKASGWLKLAAAIVVPKHADVLALYALMSLGLLSPIASNTILPAAPDHANHTAFIVQAKQALDEGQFPLKVAPFQHDGLRYPVFQFYSQTPYLFGGLIYKYFTSTNPWLALKVIYFTGLWLAAFFTFKTGQLLGFDRATSALTGVVYITAPYLLINIHARGAYTEAFAQFLIPLLAYTSLRLVKHPTALGYLWTSLAWLMFGTSHIITFVYGSLFYVALVSILYFRRRVNGRSATSLLAAAVLGWLVSAFQWYPAATIRPLQIHSHMGNIFKASWLTPLSTLLSLTSNPPEPLGRDTTAFLHASIGIPVLIAVAGLIYFSRRLGPESSGVWPLMMLFGVAFFCSWSPVDFWALLPQTLKIAQFPYRFLIYTSAIGAVLFGYFLGAHVRNYRQPSFLLLLVALILCAQSYLPSLQRNQRSLESVIIRPDIGYGAGDYLYRASVTDSLTTYRGRYETTLPLISGDGWLMVGTELPLARAYIESTGASLLLRGTAERLTYTCDRLDLTLDGSVIATTNILPGTFEWRVPAAAFNTFRNQLGRLVFRSDCGFVPNLIDPANPDTRKLWIRVVSLRFDNSAKSSALSVKDVRPRCALIGSSVTCRLTVDDETEVELPILFYPSLLRITVNGKLVPYRPSTYGSLLLADVSVPSGTNRIVAAFIGSTVGNMMSLAGIIGTAVGIYGGYRFHRRRLESSEAENA
jgi:hypothetical protein